MSSETTEGDCDEAISDAEEELILDHEDGEDDPDDPDLNWDYVKYWFEGVASLEDFVAMQRQILASYEGLITEGWRLAYPIDSGHVNLTRKPAPTEAKEVSS